MLRVAKDYMAEGYAEAVDVFRKQYYAELDNLRNACAELKRLQATYPDDIGLRESISRAEDVIAIAEGRHR